MKEDLLMASTSSISLNASSDEGERNEVGGACDGGDKLLQTEDCPKLVDRVRGKEGADSDDAGTCLFLLCLRELRSGFVPALSCLDI